MCHKTRHLPRKVKAFLTNVKTSANSHVKSHLTFKI
uniref:Uncharacterized protein n=1 Tax=Myoviridae sp. cteBs22 TaxID=2826675 RepID=A0A8S5R1D0_9CAUD|nr:MAG TPA: hypothetical protein [Myoviridae sp. cteBs22]